MEIIKMPESLAQDRSTSGRMYQMKGILRIFDRGYVAVEDQEVVAYAAVYKGSRSGL